ncbi:hypothetical protein [Muricoccus nepalensis]|uniref:hypothetical protein n=1 Tax=Muricoccus nepalensis TaxID=1854500 RepID=UPI00112DA263|nr:hypothetical protein [Roseomonas nepalensis]
MSPAVQIKLAVLHDLPNEDGSPRGALVLPPTSAATARRPLLLLFPTVAAAAAEKGRMEGGRRG